MKKKFTIIMLLCIMAVLILDNKTALSGANNGITMCIQTVIPVLYPFLFLSVLFTSNISCIRVPFLTTIGRIMNLPANTETLWLIGLFGGYPAGAQCVSNAVEQGIISAAEGKRIMGICNNAGPSFIFGFGMHILSDLRLCFFIWSIQILSSILAGALNPKSFLSSTAQHRATHISVSTAVKKSIHSLAIICGWVLLFRIMIELLEKWLLWIFPKEVQIFLCGILELTNGCMKLLSIHSVALRFLFFSVFLSFGSLCVTMQTLAISGVDIRLYLSEKLLQTLLSMLLSTIFSFFLFTDLPSAVYISVALCVTIVGIFLIILKKKFPKKSRNKEPNVI